MLERVFVCESVFEFVSVWGWRWGGPRCAEGREPSPLAEARRPTTPTKHGHEHEHGLAHDHEDDSRAVVFTDAGDASRLGAQSRRV